MADFNKIGLLLTRGNTFLVCRKNNYTSKLIMPGGQVEDGESPEECLAREIREELGGIDIADVSYFGTYEDVAASDDPTIKKTVRIDLYTARTLAQPTPSEEIVELIWFGPHDDTAELSAIIANKILPDLLDRRVLSRD